MENSHQYMVDSLIKDGYLKTPAIIEAFKAIDRADFVPEEHRHEAYVNASLPIGFGQTISQPLVVAFMLELLELKDGEKILDVGAGSGWTTALLAQITSKQSTDHGLRQGGDGAPGGNPLVVVSSQRSVVAIELISELKQFAEQNINKYGFIKTGVVKLIRGDGARGYKREAPYDKILAGAAAHEDIPAAWKSQVKIGGRIVAPVGANIRVIDKIGKNQYNTRDYFGFSFVPLIQD